MLENTDTLLSLAEIAAAFAGFAALVSVIRRGAREHHEAVHDLLFSLVDILLLILFRRNCCQVLIQFL